MIKKLSQIEAAVAVLVKSKQPMNCIAMVEAMQVQGLWSTPGGATPEATVSHYTFSSSGTFFVSRHAAICRTACRNLASFSTSDMRR